MLINEYIRVFIAFISYISKISPYSYKSPKVFLMVIYISSCRGTTISSNTYMYLVTSHLIYLYALHTPNFSLINMTSLEQIFQSKEISTLSGYIFPNHFPKSFTTLHSQRCINLHFTKVFIYLFFILKANSNLLNSQFTSHFFC